MKGKIYWKIIS